MANSKKNSNGSSDVGRRKNIDTIALFNELAAKGAKLDPLSEEAVLQNERQKMLYHNTETLMRSYRDLIWLQECFPKELAFSLELYTGTGKNNRVTGEDILNRIDSEIARGNDRLERRAASYGKTLTLLDRINDAIEVVRMKPGNGEQLYNVIYETFIRMPEANEEPLSAYEIIARTGLPDKKYYEMRKEALRIISMRLWAVPDEKLGALIEVLDKLKK